MTWKIWNKRFWKGNSFYALGLGFGKFAVSKFVQKMTNFKFETAKLFEFCFSNWVLSRLLRMFTRNVMTLRGTKVKLDLKDHWRTRSLKTLLFFQFSFNFEFRTNFFKVSVSVPGTFWMKLRREKSLTSIDVDLDCRH